MSVVVFGFVNFIAFKAGKKRRSPLAGMVDVLAVSKANLSSSAVVTDGTAVELSQGLYAYRMTGADTTANFYLRRVHHCRCHRRCTATQRVDGAGHGGARRHHGQVPRQPWTGPPT